MRYGRYASYRDAYTPARSYGTASSQRSSNQFFTLATGVGSYRPRLSSRFRVSPAAVKFDEPAITPSFSVANKNAFPDRKAFSYRLTFSFPVAMKSRSRRTDF